jgi:pimeloyl-ACP methyl ester carboxylesterase
MRERFVTSFDGTELFVEDSGEGLPLVLSDGIGCGGFIWKHVRRSLGKNHRVIHWNYRGHGKSQPPRDMDSLSMDALRKDLAHVVDALELERAVFFGHSMGTQVILDYAVENPDRVAGLVPMCGSYGRVLDTFHDNGMLAAVFPSARDLILRFPALAQTVWRTVVSSEVAYQFALATEANASLTRREDFWPYFEHMAGMDVRVFVRLLDSAGAHSMETRLHEIGAPTLVVAGERDSFTPMWLSERMRDLIPASEFLTVPGGTHIAPIEIPELVNLRVERFLTERVRDAGPTPRSAKAARRPSGTKASTPRPPEGDHGAPQVADEEAAVAASTGATSRSKASGSGRSATRRRKRGA